MKGSNLTKALRLVKHHLLQPQYLARYIDFVVSPNIQPLEMQLPWISYGAIDYLNNYLKSEMSVFEWGAGGSTLYFSEWCKSITSIESNTDWLNKLNEEIEHSARDNIELLHRELSLSSLEDFKSSPYAQALGEKRYDVIFIDGYEEDLQLRPYCFERALDNIKPGGIIIVDDSWRYPQLRIGRDVKTFTSVGPCRYGVTETDIFFF